MIDRLLGTVDWNSSETGAKVRKVERAFYTVLRRKLSPVLFIQKVCENDLSIAAVCMAKIKNTISGFDDSRCREIIIDRVEAIIKSGNHKVTEYAAGCLAALVLRDYSLVDDIFFICSNLDENDQECILKSIACKLDMTGACPEKFIVFLSAAYMNFSSNVSSRIMEYFPYQLPLGDAYSNNPYFEKLIKSVVENSDYTALYWLTEIFADLDFKRACIEDSERFAGDIVEADDYRGMLILAKWVTKYSGSFGEGIDRLWDYIKKGDGKNAQWMSFYCLSLAIAHGGNADAAVDKYVPLPYRGTMDEIPVEKTAEAISMAVDVLIESRSLKTAAYLKRINDYNVFKFPAGGHDIEWAGQVRRNRHNYCSSMVECGLRAEEIVFIYMNSHLRKVSGFYRMIRQLCEGEEYCKSEACYLYDLFEHYPLTGECVFVDGKLRIKFDNVYTSYYAALNNRWANNNRTYIANKLLNGTEVVARVSCYYRGKKALTVQDVIRARDEDLSLWREPAYGRLKNLFEQVLKCGDFTEQQKSEFQRLNMVDIEECGKSAETALYILDICGRLSCDFSKVKFFLQTVNRCFDGRLNKYRYVDFSPRMEDIPKEEYRAVFPRVREVWKVLKKSGLKPEELAHIYSNTILKRVIAIEDLVGACFNIPHNDEYVDISPVFGSRWYSGRLLIINEKTLAIYPEVFNKGRALFNYYFPEGSPKEHYGRMQRLYFRLKGYNPAKHQFIIGEFSSARDMYKIEPTGYFIKTIAETAEISNENIADYKRKLLASPMVRIEPVHLPGLIAKLDRAVRFRRKSVQDIMDYFSLLGINNVFRLSDKHLLDMEFTSRTRGHKISYLFGILHDTTLDDGLYLYLNTYFKYFMGLDEFFRFYYEANPSKRSAGCSVEEYNIRFRAYPVICSSGRTINVKCNRYLIDGAPADPDRDYRLITTGYRKDNGCVLFSDMDTVFESV